MKAWVPLLLSLAGVVALAAPDRFQIVRDGVHLRDSPGPAFESDVLALLAFTRYRPDALLAVGSEPLLQLAGARPYKELARSR